MLLILVLAGGLVGEMLGRVRQRRRCDRFVADLRVFAAAFENHARQNRNALPAGAGDSTVPTGMEDRLKETNWSKGSPFGGDYGWLAAPPAGPTTEGAGPPAIRGGAIVLTAFTPRFPLELSRRDLLAIDARIDDGNLATGRFRTGFNGWPVYLVGENP
jgi:type II secretory pathway pseudopilin PulG